MWSLFVSLLTAALCGCALSAVSDKEFADLKTAVEEVKKVNDVQRSVITSLARQVSQQQLHVEEVTRSHGDSGLKLTRLTRTGSKTYFATTFSDKRTASIHDHSNYRGTVGMGELVAVLNGVEFRTRHNDYKMVMPSRTSKKYGLTEPIPYPDVPPEVLSKPTIELQIQEMREWFKAWKNTDRSKRDYTKYFKANLCYLEGQWTNANEGAIDEPFSSDRHAIDAKSFFDLQAKIQYTADTGRKSTKENYAYLPSRISHVDDFGNIAYSQWNYQILCHPLKRHVPVSRFRLEEDLATRVANGKRPEDMVRDRSARFSLYEELSDSFSPSKRDKFTKESQGTFLDMLMSEIPGKDNYPADLIDDVFGEIAYPRDANTSNKTNLPKPLNVGYYHNSYKTVGNDAMGVSIARRGFSDSNLYIAYNNQSKVANSNVVGKCIRLWASCSNYEFKKTGCKKYDCPEYNHKVSYAIPLEIIYTTPLQSWNPYKLKMQSDADVPVGKLPGKPPTRDGKMTKDKALDGVHEKQYYLTPAAFYEKLKDGKSDPADTVKNNAVGVLDQSGEVRAVVSSGISVMTKNIPDIGPMRIRYPIMPLHESGNLVYKELHALTDMTLKRHVYEQLYPDVRMDNGTFEEVFVFETSSTNSYPPGPHVHTFELTLSEIEYLRAGKTNQVTVVTSSNAGHEHELIIRLAMPWNGLYIRQCDGQYGKCWDGHTNSVRCPDCISKYPVSNM